MEEKKPSVLFVDDEKNILSAYRRLFINKPYEVFFAESALKALKLINDSKPDVIVTDLKMPEIDGIEFLYRTKTKCPESVRIMISAISDKDQVLKVIKEGLVWKYLLKPCDESQLIEVINEAVQLGKKANQDQSAEYSINIGKKIFFMYPPSIFTKELIADLIYEGYECYELNGHEKIDELLSKYRDSLLFINIDKEIKNLEWDKYISSLLNNRDIPGQNIGIMSFIPDQQLRQHYLADVGINCGFIQLKTGSSRIPTALLEVLEAAKAKGRRQAVRVKIPKTEKGLFNIKYKSEIFKGRIINFSADAMACILEKRSGIQLDDVLENIQLVIKGIPIHTRGVVKIRKYQNGEILLIINFEHKKDDIRWKLCKLIKKFLTDKINKEITPI